VSFQLYIHVPFCRSKCAYCAFYSVTARERTREYLDELSARLEIFRRKETGDPETVYIGGGTPSVLTEAELTDFFAILERNFPCRAAGEISLEANPETLTAEKIALLHNHINRLSMGVQSFSATIRKTLGRDCSDAATAKALQLIGAKPFPHFNIDLMYAVPGQTMCDWETDLRRAAESGADHISCYSLTPEEGTQLVRDGLRQIDDAMSADMWEAAGEILAAYGLARYEISNYAKPGAECVHNVQVWRGSRLFGFGPAAASYDATRRFTEPYSLEAWLRRAAPDYDVLPDSARLREIAVMNLRTVNGWRREDFLRLPHADTATWEQFNMECRKLAEQYPGLLICTGDTLKLTAKGLLFWDTAAVELLEG